MSEQIYARDGLVHIALDDYPASYTVDEACECARQLAEAADECERQRAAIEAACADGHQWGEHHNSWLGADRKVTYQWCRREGCTAQQVLDGWVQFAGREHRHPVTGSLIACWGPGCDLCDDEKAAAAMLAMLRPVIATALAADAWP